MHIYFHYIHPSKFNMPSAKYIAIIVSKDISAYDLSTTLSDHDSAFMDKDTKFSERPFGKRYQWCVGSQKRHLGGVETEVTCLCLLSLYPIKKAKLKELNIVMPGWYLSFANDSECSKRDIAIAFQKRLCFGPPPIAESTFWEENLGEMSEKLGSIFTKWSTGTSNSAPNAFGAAFEASLTVKKITLPPPKISSPKSPKTLEAIAKAAAIAEEEELDDMFA